MTSSSSSLYMSRNGWNATLLRRRKISHGIIITIFTCIVGGTLLYRIIDQPLLNLLSSSTSTSKKCSNGNCDLAKYDSYDFFDDIDNMEWNYKKLMTHKYYQSWFMNATDPEYGLTYNDNTNTDTTTTTNNNANIEKWLMHNVIPIFTCNYVMRLGGYYDHGKWTCDIHRLSKKKNGCLIYSIGSAGGHYEFENDINTILLNYNNMNPCEIHIFDPSPIPLLDTTTNQMSFNTTIKNNIYYHSWGIKTINATHVNNKYQFLTFDETLYKLNHINKHLDIIKLDCESCEFTIYNDILKYSNQITQLLIEIHPTIYRPNHLKLSNFFMDIKKHNFIPFYRESHITTTSNNMDITYEFSFIRLRNMYT